MSEEPGSALPQAREVLGSSQEAQGSECCLQDLGKVSTLPETPVASVKWAYCRIQLLIYV